MKTKMKTMISVCTLGILLYGCTKDNPTPDPVLDCMGVENGLAVLDECGNCHQSYIYDPVNNHSVEYINDTTGVVLGPTEMLILAGSLEDIANNPNWNGGPLAAIDSCGDCHSSYIYDPVNNHSVEYINDTTGVVLGPTEMLILAGSLEDIANNPNWNAGCK
jgi:nitrous oxide reductase accessory protein NosL